MKRASKPPTPLQTSAHDDGSRSRKVAADVPGRAPPVASGPRNISPFAAASAQSDADDYAESLDDIVEEDVDPDDLDTHRPAAPTIPFVPTPEAEWRPAPLPSFGNHRPPSSHSLPTAPNRTNPAPDRSMEAALREQMWSGLAAPPTQTAQTGPHMPVQLHRGYAHVPPAPTSSSSVISSPGSGVSGTYATISEQRALAAARTGRGTHPDDEGWPLGYVVASAFFLAIATVGFGLWLAFEVIAL